MEDASRVGESIGLSVWCEDEAGPFQTVPYAGESWQAEGEPDRQPHEYVRNGTAKCLTLFHPASGQVRVNGVTHCPNTILHAWLRTELSTIVAALPEPCTTLDSATTRALWEGWQVGLTAPVPLPNDLPPLRMLLLLDNLKGHKPPAFVQWLIAHGIMPLYTPLGGSWLNMAESIQRILKQRASTRRRRRQSSLGWKRWRRRGTATQRPSSGAASGRCAAPAVVRDGMRKAARAPARVGQSCACAGRSWMNGDVRIK